MSEEQSDSPSPASREQRSEAHARGKTFRGTLLDPFQSRAIRYLEQGFSVLVCAPTGTGKTLIADFLVDEILGSGGHVVYTAPIKALSNQKYREYTRAHEASAVGLITGDMVINREAPLRIMTTEILRNMLLEGEPLEELKGVIIDEIHFLDDEERGTVWEEVLIHLPRTVRILGLSATLANLDEFAAWLTFVRGSEVKVVRERKRAVPLTHWLANVQSGLVSASDYRENWLAWRKELSDQPQAPAGGRRGGGRRRRRSGHAAPTTTPHDIVEQLRAGYLPALYFVFSRKQTEEFARQLAARVALPFVGPAESNRIQARLEQFEREYPLVLTDEHRAMYAKGIAFHHAGAHVAIKALVEELYERRLVYVLFCTSTFALGINMPARTVVFDSIMKYDGRSVVPLTVRQYMQKAGRAGRRGIDDHGHVVVRLDYADYDNLREDIARLHQGRYEPVSSSFNLSFNSVVSLIRQHSMPEVREIVERSFLSFHLQREARLLAEQLPRLAQRVEKFRPETPEAFEAMGHKEKHRLAREEKKLRQMEKKQKASESWTWEAFNQKIDFLQTTGYVAEDGTFLAGAEILQHVQIQEILVTELILNGVFEEVPMSVFFGILTGLVQELPRSAFVRKPRESWWYDLFRRVNRIRHSDVVRQADALSGTESVYAPYMMPLGYRWAEGDRLADILGDVESPTDVAGDLVSAFRRAKDLASQIREVYRADEDRFRAIGDLMRSVTRDEVEVLD